jgi:radical SAM protein with 4Fe4S-binding SPASM domain
VKGKKGQQGVNFYNDPEIEKFRYNPYRKANRELAEKMYRGEIDPRPLHIIIETSSRCNLKCGFCNREAGLNRPQQDMTLEVFKEVADQAVEMRVHSLSLYALGEPMLNKDIGKMIIYAKSLGIPYVDLSTNGMYDMKKLLGTGLNELIISIDGFKATHEKLREGADYDRIKENLSELTTAKWKRRDAFPYIRMQCIDLPETHDRIDDFIDYWKKKVDVVYIKTLETMAQNLGDKNAPQKVLDTLMVNRVPCKQLYFALTVTSNGDIAYCCHDPKDKSTLGHISKMTLEQAWNKLAPIRQRHNKGDYTELCANCTDWNW